MPIAVQATGHGLANPLAGEGVLVSTRRMDSVDVDPGERHRRVGARARRVGSLHHFGSSSRWGAVHSAEGAERSQPPRGDVPAVCCRCGSPDNQVERTSARALHDELLAGWSGTAIDSSPNFTFGRPDQRAAAELFDAERRDRLLQLARKYDPAGLLHPSFVIA
ncbi:hypothetical protein QF037_000690 [Streptomyces canus]|uniref:hypothetical protein n=1 Tax=Streptomyces canus TaxID=58343 RepID=UPI002784EB8E|nr:hypothetical protein [Streptomyces canus]MDQ0596345.1 hypothetical protein [Streptomyces canus]